jgi:hypothetical protein
MGLAEPVEVIGGGKNEASRAIVQNPLQVFRRNLGVEGRRRPRR